MGSIEEEVVLVLLAVAFVVGIVMVFAGGQASIYGPFISLAAYLIFRSIKKPKG